MARRRRLSRAVTVRLLTTVVFAGGAVFGAVPPTAEALATPTVGELAAMCGGFRIIPTPDGKAMCTHGPDPAPPDVDFPAPPVAVPGTAQGLIFTDPPGDAPSKAAA